MSAYTQQTIANQQRISAELQKAYGLSKKIELDCGGTPILWVEKADELPLLLKDLRCDANLRFNLLSDITAYDNIDGIDGPKRFIVVYQLYSLPYHARLRVKLAVDDGASAPSIVHLWKAADWLEREVYDLFGIPFKGHPDLRRIMMDERFQGHPLRKEFGLKDRQPFPDSLPVRIIEKRGTGSST